MLDEFRSFLAAGDKSATVFLRLTGNGEVNPVVNDRATKTTDSLDQTVRILKLRQHLVTILIKWREDVESIKDAGHGEPKASICEMTARAYASPEPKDS